SWDGDVRVWDIFEKKGEKKGAAVLNHSSEVIAVHFSPASVVSIGRLLMSLTRRGIVSMWDADATKLLFQTDISQDCVGIGGLRSEKQDLSAGTYGFTSFAFSPEGACILAVGNNPYACLYDVSSLGGAILLRRFRIAPDRLFPGITRIGAKLWEINGMKSKTGIMDNGWDDIAEFSGSESDPEERLRANNTLDGKRGLQGDELARQSGSKWISIAQTGTMFAVATGRGAVLFESDAQAMVFDPSELTEEVTEEAILGAIEDKRWTTAVRTALRLGEYKLIILAVESCPPDCIDQVISSLTPVQMLSQPGILSTSHLGRLLAFFARYGESSPHIELVLMWIVTLLSTHSSIIMK
ncbi:MAG: putative WD repeat protein, partial [Streblomastix strix]